MTTTTPPPSTPGGLTKSVVTLDRVVIRLAGDSGDGMQLTGNRFTSETASFGNDLSTLPNFPAEIRAPTGTLPGVSSFQLHFADHDIMTPGDAPDVLVVMNPAALKANIADLPGGSLLIIDSDEFSDRNLTKVGYATQPAGGRLAGGLAGGERAAHVDDARRARRLGAREEGGPAVEEHVHARAALVDVPPADRGHDPVPGADRSAGSRRSRRRTSPRSGPGSTTARPPRRSRSPTRSSPPRWRRARTATSRATRRCPTASSRPGSAPACRSSSARTRSRRRRTSCTSCPSTRRSTSGRSRPRTRSPASARPSAPRSAVRSG